MKKRFTILLVLSLTITAVVVAGERFAKQATGLKRSTPVAWNIIDDEVSTKLLSGKQDLIQWAAELVDQEPKDAEAALVKIQVMWRVGLDRHAAKTVGEFKKLHHGMDFHTLHEILRRLYDNATTFHAWETALAVVETFPEQISSEFELQQLLDHLKQTGWSDERLEQWLKTMQQRAVKDSSPAQNWAGHIPLLYCPEVNWSKFLMDRQKTPKEKAAIVASFEKAARENPTDFRKIIGYLEVCQLSGVGDNSDLARVTGLFKPRRSTDACRVAQKLQSQGQWASAARLYRFAIETPLQKDESSMIPCFFATQVPLSPIQGLINHYNSQIRRGLSTCLMQLGKKEEAQKWLAEAAKYDKQRRLQLPLALVGREGQEAAVDEVEQRILAEEPQSKDKADYWLDRANLYEQWQRIDPKVDKKAEIEHAYRQGLNIAKPEPRPVGFKKSPQGTRSALFSGYFRFLDHNKRYDDAFSLLTTEIRTVPAESDSTGIAIWQLSSRNCNSQRYFNRLKPDDPILWKWLAERKNWDYYEINLLGDLAEQIGKADEKQRPDLYRGFIGRIEVLASDKNPTHAIGCARIVIDASRLGIPAKPEKAIPWLHEAFMHEVNQKDDDPNQKRIRKYRIRTINDLLLNVYLASGELKKAEKLTDTDDYLGDHFTYRDRLAKLALEAAKQNDEMLAMKTWRRVANVSLNDGIIRILEKRLRELGLGEQIDAYYRDVQKKLPEFVLRR